jgi:hypothetical protein
MKNRWQSLNSRLPGIASLHDRHNAIIQTN